MLNFFRSLFGFGRPSGYRTVAGAPATPATKEAAYLRNSTIRLNVLQELHSKYKFTVHAPKLEAVFEKTKAIHYYLKSKKRLHELELFHVQHTDHFISTYKTILEAHLRHSPPPITVSKPQQTPSPTRPKPRPQPQRQQPQPVTTQFEDKVEGVLRKIEAETIKGLHTAHRVTEMVRRVAGQAPNWPSVPTETLPANPLALSLPTIAIDTFSRISYVLEEGKDGKVWREIGFTGTDEEKASFVTHVADKLGIAPDKLTYMGNTVLAVPGGLGRGQAMYAPVLNWNGCAYALNLQDYRLFPVRTYRRGK